MYVMLAVPYPRPVTTPAGLIDTIEVLPVLRLHVPPIGVPVNVSLEPKHKGVAPVILGRG